MAGEIKSSGLSAGTASQSIDSAGQSKPVAKKKAPAGAPADQKAPDLTRPEVQSGIKAANHAEHSGLRPARMAHESGVLADNAEVTEFKSLAARKMRDVAAQVPASERGPVQKAFDDFHSTPNAATLGKFTSVAQAALAKAKKDPAAAYKLAHGQLALMAHNPALSAAQQSGVERRLAHIEARMSAGEISQAEATNELNRLLGEGNTAIKRDRAIEDDAAASRRLADSEAALRNAQAGGDSTEVERAEQDLATARRQSEAASQQRTAAVQAAEGLGRGPWVPFGE